MYRERDTDMYVCIYIYIYIYVFSGEAPGEGREGGRHVAEGGPPMEAVAEI